MGKKQARNFIALPLLTVFQSGNIIPILWLFLELDGGCLAFFEHVRHNFERRKIMLTNTCLSPLGFSKQLIVALVLVAPALAPQRAAAQFNQQGSKIVSENGVNAVAVSADATTMIVGIGGGAEVFTRSGNTWTLQASLFGMGGMGGTSSNFGGVALSADGNTAIVGESADNPSGNRQIGAVWVFTRNGVVWSQQGPKLVGTGYSVDTYPVYQGISVALSADGNTASWGGAYDNNGIGAVWVFTRSAGIWSQQGPKLVGTGVGGAYSYQGGSVALSADGNILIEGGPLDNNYTGAAWVFTRQAGVWYQMGSKLVAPDAIGSAEQGTSVALIGNQFQSIALVGGPKDNGGVGAAWTWFLDNPRASYSSSKLSATDNVGSSGQGASVALSADGSIAVLGGPGDNDGVGATWTFVPGTSAYSPMQKLIGSGYSGIPRQGASVAISSDASTIVAGGPYDGSTGAAWAFAQPVVAYPYILSISPPGGPPVGNTTMTITGYNFLGTDLVQFNGNPAASFQELSPYSITVTSPPNPPTVAGVEIGTFIGTNIGERLQYYFTYWSSSHDFNNDGNSDILWRDANNNIAIWLMDGNTILQSAIIGNVPGWQIIGQHDFNGDGNADLLWRDGGNLAIWLMSGSAVVSSFGIGTVPLNWSVYGTGDLSGDRLGDLLWRDSNTGAVAIWFVSAVSGTHANITTASLGAMPSNWSLIGDDNNGNIFWRDSAGGLAMWTVNGSGQLTTSIALGNAPTNWVIAGFGDFNGDLSTDILWRDTSTGEVAIWFLNRSGFLSAVGLGVVPFQTWPVLQTGDYNGVGMSDLLWVDTTGNVAQWFINSGTISSTNILGNVGTNWTIQSGNSE
jgi:IPT/TIG domain